MPRLLGPDPDLPVVFSRDHALAAGITSDQIAYRLRVGRWQRVAVGWFRRTDWAPPGLDAHARERIDHVHRAVLAAGRQPGSTIGYRSAVLVHGYPLAVPVPKAVTLIVAPGRWTGTRHGICVRQGAVCREDLAPFRVRVTSVARTWLDIARTGSLADALTMGDAAMRTGALDPEVIPPMLEPLAGQRGCRRAASALRHLDGRRESPLESQSWAYWVSNGVELPELQVEIVARSGRFIARVDVLWRRARLVGECDGRLKYQSPDDLYAEKRREDAIRAEGFRVVRWGASDLRSDVLAQRVRRLLA